LLIASKRTNGGSALLVAELCKRVADSRLICVTSLCDQSPIRGAVKDPLTQPRPGPDLGRGACSSFRRQLFAKADIAASRVSARSTNSISLFYLTGDWGIIPPIATPTSATTSLGNGRRGSYTTDRFSLLHECEFGGRLLSGPRKGARRTSAGACRATRSSSVYQWLRGLATSVICCEGWIPRTSDSRYG
jgi:hypothetical protein